VAYANWFAGIQRLPVSVVSFLGLRSPLVATIAGWILLGEELTTIQLFGALLVLAAVAAPQVGSLVQGTKTTRPTMPAFRS